MYSVCLGLESRKSKKHCIMEEIDTYFKAWITLCHDDGNLEGWHVCKRDTFTMVSISSTILDIFLHEHLV